MRRRSRGRGRGRRSYGRGRRSSTRRMSAKKSGFYSRRVGRRL